MGPTRGEGRRLCQGTSLGLVSPGDRHLLGDFRLQSDTIRFGFCVDHSGCQRRMGGRGRAPSPASEARMAHVR